MLDEEVVYEFEVVSSVFLYTFTEQENFRILKAKIVLSGIVADPLWHVKGQVRIDHFLESAIVVFRMEKYSRTSKFKFPFRMHQISI